MSEFYRRIFKLKCKFNCSLEILILQVDDYYDEIKKMMYDKKNFLKHMALIPFKSTDKKGKASSKSLFALTVILFAVTGWALIFK